MTRAISSTKETRDDLNKYLIRHSYVLDQIENDPIKAKFMIVYHTKTYAQTSPQTGVELTQALPQQLVRAD